MRRRFSLLVPSTNRGNEEDHRNGKTKLHAAVICEVMGVLLDHQTHMPALGHTSARCPPYSGLHGLGRKESMNLPINERFTSIQKDDLKAALAKDVDGVAPDAQWDRLSERIHSAVRHALEDEGLDLDLSDDQINNIASDVAEEVGDGLDRDDYATDQIVQAVEDFLCI